MSWPAAASRAELLATLHGVGSRVQHMQDLIDFNLKPDSAMISFAVCCNFLVERACKLGGAETARTCGLWVVFRPCGSVSYGERRACP